MTSLESTTHLASGPRLTVQFPQQQPVYPSQSNDVPVTSDQSYFWTAEWQAGENAADSDIQKGILITLDTAEDIDALFEELDANDAG